MHASNACVGKSISSSSSCSVSAFYVQGSTPEAQGRTYFEFDVHQWYTATALPKTSCCYLHVGFTLHICTCYCTANEHTRFFLLFFPPRSLSLSIHVGAEQPCNSDNSQHNTKLLDSTRLCLHRGSHFLLQQYGSHSVRERGAFVLFLILLGRRHWSGGRE